MRSDGEAIVKAAHDAFMADLESALRDKLMVEAQAAVEQTIHEVMYGINNRTSGGYCIRTLSYPVHHTVTITRRTP